MIINFFGNQFLKFQVSDTVIAVDPFGSESKLKGPKFGADIVLQTTLHEDMSGGKLMTYGNKIPYIIKGPGEYEVSEVFIKGYNTYTNYDLLDNISANTYYLLEFDNIKLLILGSAEKHDKKIVIDNDIDIMFIPITGDGRYDAKTAVEIINNIEPKVIIPYGFKDIKDKNIQIFLNEIGVKEYDTLDKYTVKKKDIDNQNGKVIILNNE